MPREVEALRASLDSRLTALEQALADPTQHASLEALIIELARIATEEADATSRRAVLEAQKAGQSAAALARTEATEALEAEKVESAALRQVIEQARAALKQAETALKEERRSAEAANREAAGAQRELAAMRETLEQHQSGSANERRELDAVRAAFEAERVRASAREQELNDAGARLESEKTALAVELERHRAELDAERAAASQMLETSSDLEQNLATVRGELDESRGQLDAVRRELDGVRRELEEARAERDASRDERDVVRRELEAASRDLDSVRADSEARTHTLSQSQAEQESALKTAQDAARSAAGELEQALRERDAAQSEAAALEQRLEAAADVIRERDDLKRELQAAHQAHEARDAAELLAARGSDATAEEEPETVIDLTSIAQDEERQQAVEGRIRALELALRDAETRADSAELELDGYRRPAVRSEPSAAPPEPPPESKESEPEQFRGPARAARRVAFKGDVDVQIDGTPGKLVDLSMSGAQVLTLTSMKPGRLAKVTLPMGDEAIPCAAKVMWSRLEPRSGQLWYRAGVAFTSADEVALAAFLEAQQK